jgi:hypothetical protein
MEVHLFQPRVFEGLLGTAKFFEHLDASNLSATRLVLLLDPTKYAAANIYPLSQRALVSFCTISELHLETSHLTLSKPARNNLIFHGRRAHETWFSIRRRHCSLNAFCSPPSQWY